MHCIYIIFFENDIKFSEYILLQVSSHFVSGCSCRSVGYDEESHYGDQSSILCAMIKEEVDLLFICKYYSNLRMSNSLATVKCTNIYVGFKC